MMTQKYKVFVCPKCHWRCGDIPSTAFNEYQYNQHLREEHYIKPIVREVREEV